MTPVTGLALSGARQRLLVRAIQLVLLAQVAFGIATLEPGVATAGAVALAVTLLPALLRREYRYATGPGLALWLAAAVFLHNLGSIGLYGEFQWYDEVTHTVSATLVAGIGYASFRALELHSDEIDVPPLFRSVFVVVFVLAAAVVWELVEFALGGFFTVYGVDDVATDMVFNAVGALVLAAWGTGSVRGLVDFFGRRLRARSGE